MERACAFGPNRNLIGILGEPEALAAAVERPGIILLNGGLVHRVGPVRLYVEICRRLSEAGFLSFRFDQTGLGDSAGGADRRSLDECARQDAVVAMDYLSATKGCRRFILIGLCSGADNAYYVAVGDRRVVGMIWLDGIAYRDLTYYVRHYAPRIVSAPTWRRLLRRTARRLKSLGDHTLEFPPIRDFPPRKVLRQELQTLIDAGMRLLLIYSGGVREYYNHKAQFRRIIGPFGAEGQVIEEFYPEFDHVYFLLEDRAVVVDRIAQWVTSQFGAARAGEWTRPGAAQADHVADIRGRAETRANLAGE